MVVFDENCWDERALWIAYLLLASQWCRAPGNISSLVKFMTLAASAQANVFGSYVQSNSSSSWLLYTLHKPSITGVQSCRSSYTFVLTVNKAAQSPVVKAEEQVNASTAGLLTSDSHSFSSL
ncbi:uncharacterized [Tachysurus ichikawai]